MNIPCVLSSLLVFASITASQAVLISDDFNDGNDTGWTRNSPLTPFGAGGVYSFPGGNSYNILAPISPNPVALGAGRAGSIRQDATYFDFGVSIDVLDWSVSEPDTIIGVLSRTSQVGLGTTDGYAALLDVGGTFSIQVITNEAPGAVIAGAPVAGLSANGDYRIVFSGIGQNLTAILYDIGNPSTPLATISGTDGTYASGFSGMFVFDSSTAGNHIAQATFDNFIAVPEPSTMALGGLGLIGLLSRRRKG